METNKIRRRIDRLFHAKFHVGSDQCMGIETP